MKYILGRARGLLQSDLDTMQDDVTALETEWFNKKLFQAWLILCFSALYVGVTVLVFVFDVPI
jgi:hypothetical protein